MNAQFNLYFFKRVGDTSLLLLLLLLLQLGKANIIATPTSTPTPTPNSATIRAHRQPFRKYNHSIKINSKRVCKEQTDSASRESVEMIGERERG